MRSGRVVDRAMENIWSKHKPETAVAASTVAGSPERPSRPAPEAVLAGQNRILERIANNVALDEVLDSIAWLIESQAPEVVCSILLLKDGKLRHGGAPSLPRAYCEAIDGTAIGPSVGSCGTAAFIKRAVIVSDIATDPLWADYRGLALRYGLLACWSTPIMSDDGEVLGTFALYGHAVGEPRPSHLRLVQMATHIAKIAIERHLADEALKQHAAQLVAANQRKDEFIAMLAHELRNPLAPIVMALELMRLGGDDPAIVGKYREVMERQVRHLTRLIDDLLDISRITQGKVELRKERVTVDALVARALEQVTPLIEQQHHRLHVSLAAPAIEIDADPVRMAQVLANLLNNAAKYSPQSSDIFVGAELAGNIVTIRVRDTGLGMTPETLARAFELFAQADRSDGRAQGGLGIGLTLVRRIVEMHGGEVEARSAGLGQGSELIVRLPAPARGEGRAEDGAGAARARQGRSLRAGLASGA
jgi:signal transduction histidine kinase